MEAQIILTSENGWTLDQLRQLRSFDHVTRLDALHMTPEGRIPAARIVFGELEDALEFKAMFEILKQELGL